MSSFPKRILYAGPFRFPDGDAAAQRVLGVAKAIRSLGTPVEFCGWRKKNHPDDREVGECKSFDGFEYWTVPEFRSGKEQWHARLLNHLTEGRETLAWLEQRATKDDLVIVYNFYGIYASKIIDFCRAKGISVVVDSVEWYEPHQCAGGRFGLLRWEVEYSLRRTFRRADGILAISAFLQRHFASTTKTIRVPPLVDVQDAKWRAMSPINRSGEEIHLCYAGIPARKDNLTNLLSALALLEQEGDRRFHLTLIGPDRSHVASLLDTAGIQPIANLHCPGRLPHSETIQTSIASDYAALIRPNQRYAHAGFSTKFVESMAAGAIPFCNITSDIAEYSRDGVDSIHLGSDSTEDILAGLRRIGQIGANQRVEMREAAKGAAARWFDWRNYTAALGEFMEYAVSRARKA